MKYYLAKYANAALLTIAALLLTTNSLFYHRPETPIELLKK